jgi:hypothetical protein
VANPQATGYLDVFPGGSAPPLTSSVNFTKGRTRANNLVIGVSSDGRSSVAVYTGSTSSVELILDVNGFFR